MEPMGRVTIATTHSSASAVQACAPAKRASATGSGLDGALAGISADVAWRFHGSYML